MKRNACLPSIARVMYAVAFLATNSFVAGTAGGAEFCWSSSFSVPYSEPGAPTVSVDGSNGRVWIARNEDGTVAVLSPSSGGRWVKMTGLPSPVMDLWPPSIAATTDGRAYLAFTIVTPDRNHKLVVAETDGKQLRVLGEPLLTIAAGTDFTWVYRPHLALSAGFPIVTWDEGVESHSLTVRAARWSGESWELFPAIPGPNAISPKNSTLAVGADGNPWIAWLEGDPEHVRVSRWKKNSWSTLGNAQLDAFVGRAAMVGAQLIVLGEDHALLGWRQIGEGSGEVLRFAEWSRGTWSLVGSPDAGRKIKIFEMRVLAGMPLLAWNEWGPKRALAVSVARFERHRWHRMLSGLHVQQGGSAGIDAMFALPDDRIGLAISESGRGDKLEILELYRCAPGQTPTTVPLGSGEEHWPTTVPEAAAIWLSAMSEANRAEFATRDLSEFAPLATGVRNRFGLWRGNDALLRSCGNGRKVSAEECSEIILETARRLAITRPHEVHRR